MLAGGVSQGVQLDEESTRILQKVREVDPTVANLELTSLDSQVVSGMMYTYHFGDKTVKAWSQPWLQGRVEITTTEGQKVETSVPA